MADKFYAGIVGSRRRNTLSDRKIVFSIVERLYTEFGNSLVLVSGACKSSADEFANDAARFYNIEIIEYPIDRNRATDRLSFTKLAYERNRKIAETSNVLFCLVSLDRKGGTENTIKHAKELSKRVYTIDSSGNFKIEA